MSHLQAGQVQLSSASPHRPSTPTSTNLQGLHWTHPSLQMSVLYWGPKNGCSIKMWSNEGWVEGIITLDYWLPSCQYSLGCWCPSLMPGHTPGSCPASLSNRTPHPFLQSCIPGSQGPACCAAALFFLLKCRTSHLPLLNFVTFLSAHSSGLTKFSWMAILQYALRKFRGKTFISSFGTDTEISLLWSKLNCLQSFRCRIPSVFHSLRMWFPLAAHRHHHWNWSPT